MKLNIYPRQREGEGLKITIRAVINIEYEVDGAYPQDIAQHYANTDARMLREGNLEIEDWPPGNIKVIEANAQTFDKATGLLYTGPARDPDANLIKVEE